MSDQEIRPCQSCGSHSPKTFVSMRQLTGAFVFRYEKDTAGLICGACIRHHYWRILGHNLMMGWWGLIAFFLNPVYTIENTIAYRRP